MTISTNFNTRLLFYVENIRHVATFRHVVIDQGKGGGAFEEHKQSHIDIIADSPADSFYFLLDHVFIEG